MKNLLLTSLAVLSLTACAPEAEKKSPAPAAQAEKNSAANGNLVPCSGADVSQAPAFESNTNLDGNVSFLRSAFKNGQQQSLCSLLASANKQVLVLQFVGVACLSCKDEAKDITARIKASPKGASMQLYTVFVDGPETGVEETWFQTFINDNTGGTAQAKFEPEKTLFRRYNGDPSGLQFGSVVVLNRFGQAFYTPNAAGIPEVFAKADQLVP